MPERNESGETPPAIDNFDGEYQRPEGFVPIAEHTAPPTPRELPDITETMPLPSISPEVLESLIENEGTLPDLDERSESSVLENDEPEAAFDDLGLYDSSTLTPAEMRWALIIAKGIEIYNKTVNPPKPRIPLPDFYEERFSIWVMIGKQVKPFGVYVIVMVSTILLISLGALPGEALSVTLWLVAIFTLAYAWLVCRIYVQWSRTILYCNDEMVGIVEPVVRWLLILKKSRAGDIQTASIITREVKEQSSFMTFFKMNASIVTIDTASDKDEFLHDMHFVRDAERLMKTIDDMKRYLAQ